MLMVEKTRKTRKPLVVELYGGTFPILLSHRDPLTFIIVGVMIMVKITKVEKSDNSKLLKRWGWRRGGMFLGTMQNHVISLQNLDPQEHVLNLVTLVGSNLNYFPFPRPKMLKRGKGDIMRMELESPRISHNLLNATFSLSNE